MALTADDVMRMVDAGIIGEDDPVELLGGVLTQLSPKSPQHGTVLGRLVRWLISSDAAGRYEVRGEHPIRVPDQTSLPEPDVAVIAGTAATEHPTSAVLVIEVAVSSLRTDVEVKAPLYAAAGAPEYWVVDVPGRRVHIFTAPAGDRYERQDVAAGGWVTPRSLDAAPLELAALFAGL